MAETNMQRLDRLHQELAVLYKYGVTDKVRLQSYWVRIDRLEDALIRERAMGLTT